MRRRSILRRVRQLVVVLFLTAVAYVGAVRPWHLRWGATDAELSRALPGDDLVPEPDGRVVRALTIDAPPERIWPWIMQVGRERGGFYSYAWLENLFGADIHNVYHLIPGLPDRKPGDDVWMAPREDGGGEYRMVVQRVEANRALVLATPRPGGALWGDGSVPPFVWSFTLAPSDSGSTRLIMLGAGPKPRRWFEGVLGVLILEPAHFIMERKMMLTLKDLAESASSAAPAPDTRRAPSEIE